jgi:hypothetical protein
MRDPQSAETGETSSRPVSIPEEQRRLFREVLQLFEADHIPFAVAGAFALHAHTGISRDTKDLDIFLTPENTHTATRSLERKGFVCEVCDPVWLFKVRRNGFFVDLITGMSNAVLVVNDSWIERARPATVLGVQTRVLGANELLLSKLFVTRRERFDGADIAHIVFGTRGELDWHYLIAAVGEHWEVLFWALVLFRYCYPAQTRFVPLKIWCELLERYQQSVIEPDPEAPFRGSLIDEKMFAIDVNEWGLDNLVEEFRRRRLEAIAAGKKSA